MLVAIDCQLDVSEYLWRQLDLVEYHRSLETSEKASRIAVCRSQNARLVQCDVSRGMLILCDPLNEGALVAF